MRARALAVITSIAMVGLLLSLPVANLMADEAADPGRAAVVGGLARGVDRDTAEPAGPRQHVIGNSVEGRPLEVTEIGTGDTAIVLIGGIHTGPEVGTVYLVRELKDHFASNPGQIPPGIRLVFLPNANPDGYVHGTRLNARNVDLNRNWLTDDWEPIATHGRHQVSAGDAPLSEPETQALYHYLLDLGPHFALSYHGYVGLIEDNGAQRSWDLSSVYAVAAGYDHISDWPYYDITGQFIDSMAEAGIAAADVELVEDDPDNFSRNLAGVLAVLDLVGRVGI